MNTAELSAERLELAAKAAYDAMVVLTINDVDPSDALLSWDMQPQPLRYQWILSTQAALAALDGEAR